VFNTSRLASLSHAFSMCEKAWLREAM